MRSIPLLEGRYIFASNASIVITIGRETPFLIEHQHDFVEIAYVAEGEGIHFIQGDKFHVSQGDLFIIPPGVPHVFQPLDLLGQHPLKVWNCMYKHEIVQGLPEFQEKKLTNEFLLKQNGFPNKESWYSFPKMRIQIEPLLQSMYHESKRKSHNAAPNLGTPLHSLLSHLSALNHSDNDMQDLCEFQYPIHMALQYMASNFYKPLSLNELSNQAALSIRHFQRLFKEMTGVSFIKMLQNIRILNSLWLLQHTDRSIQSIAQQVGIIDMKHFYRLFQERFNITPAAIRKQPFERISNPFFNQLSVWQK